MTTITDLPMPTAEEVASLLNQIYTIGSPSSLNLDAKNQLYEKLDIAQRQVLYHWLQEQGWHFNKAMLLWEQCNGGGGDGN